VDNWTVPRLPESVARRTFQTSKRGLALRRQRSKDRRGRGDFGTASTRRRDAARWRDEKRKAQRFVLELTESQTVEAARAQSRTGRIAGLVPRISQSLRAKRKPLSGPGRREGLGTAGRQEVDPRDRFRPPTEPAPARAPGDNEPDLQLLARACRNRDRDAGPPSAPRGPRAGESGVDRKVGPISRLGAAVPRRG
jgi:hypothetical protein